MFLVSQISRCTFHSKGYYIETLNTGYGGTNLNLVRFGTNAKQNGSTSADDKLTPMSNLCKLEEVIERRDASHIPNDGSSPGLGRLEIRETKGIWGVGERK